MSITLAVTPGLVGTRYRLGSGDGPDGGLLPALRAASVSVTTALRAI